MAYVLITLAVLMLMAVIAGITVCVSLQEANDPSESSPEDLSEFEKRHVHRPDVLPRA